MVVILTKNKKIRLFNGCFKNVVWDGFNVGNVCSLDAIYCLSWQGEEKTRHLAPISQFCFVFPKEKNRLFLDRRLSSRSWEPQSDVIKGWLSEQWNVLLSWWIRFKVSFRLILNVLKACYYCHPTLTKFLWAYSPQINKTISPLLSATTGDAGRVRCAVVTEP